MKQVDLAFLLDELKKDDRQAFNEIFNGFYSPLVKFASAFLNSTEDAEDVVSCFFISLWKKRKALSMISYPETYLYTSIKNACLNYKRDYKKTMNIDEQIVYKNEPVYEQDIDAKELNKIIQKTVQTLPEQRRIVFKLVKENGMKCREVADILNVSVRTVEGQLYKAVKTLADVISAHLGYDPRKSGNNTRLMLLFI